MLHSSTLPAGDGHCSHAQDTCVVTYCMTNSPLLSRIWDTLRVFELSVPPLKTPSSNTSVVGCTLAGPPLMCGSAHTCCSEQMVHSTSRHTITEIQYLPSSDQRKGCLLPAPLRIHSVIRKPIRSCKSQSSIGAMHH